MRSTLLLGIVLATGLMTMPASAGYVVSASLTSKPDIDGTDFDYTIVLTNASASTLNVGTFWFSWVPGKDFMTNKPSVVNDPTGWGHTITGGGAGDGFAIQWVAGTNALITPGNSLTFTFTSAETPTQMAGFSSHFPTTPELTSFVYSGAPFSDAGDQFLVVAPAAVPEPSSLALCGIAGLVGLAVARLRRRASAA